MHFDATAALYALGAINIMHSATSSPCKYPTVSSHLKHPFPLLKRPMPNHSSLCLTSAASYFASSLGSFASEPESSCLWVEHFFCSHGHRASGAFSTAPDSDRWIGCCCTRESYPAAWPATAEEEHLGNLVEFCSGPRELLVNRATSTN